MFNLLMNEPFNRTYTLSATGLKFHTKRFGTRDAANKAMYQIIMKLGMSIVAIYDDRHYKTYICENGVRFYVNREY